MKRKFSSIDYSIIQSTATQLPRKEVKPRNGLPTKSEIPPNRTSTVAPVKELTVVSTDSNSLLQSNPPSSPSHQLTIWRKKEPFDFLLREDSSSKLVELLESDQEDDVVAVVVVEDVLPGYSSFAGLSMAIGNFFRTTSFLSSGSINACGDTSSNKLRHNS